MWDSDKLVNGYTLLAGMSGSGRTYTLRRMISHVLQSYCGHIPRIHLFNVHGDLSIPGALEVLFSERTNCGLNPLRANPDPQFGGVR
ncbi:hypothetical protein QP835_11585 [Pseudomonas oryzihabitans]|uniref:hypothetical protein n=1 Tax=Pseudomonas oryzihabitans TaxID=47885 RepID=UPI002553551B|nr:hypothetical protein [Pseudomonas oryzihabitans]MDK8264917.1 hypothetical protein [Pseudomonas oryzihabitans]